MAFRSVPEDLVFVAALSEAESGLGSVEQVLAACDESVGVCAAGVGDGSGRCESGSWVSKMPE